MCISGRVGYLPAGDICDIGYVQDLRQYFERDAPELLGHVEQWDDGIRTCDIEGLQR